MYSIILMTSLAAGGDGPAFFAPGGCSGRLALVEVQRTHLRLARVHSTGCSGVSAQKTGCSGVATQMPIPMTPQNAATPPKAAPVTNTAVLAPAPVAVAISAPRRVLGGARAAVCGALCGR